MHMHDKSTSHQTAIDILENAAKEKMKIVLTVQQKHSTTALLEFPVLSIILE